MRMRVKKKKKKNVILKLIMIVIFSVICSFIFIRYFSKNIGPMFLIYAEDEITRITTIVINDSVNDEVIDTIDEETLFEIVRNNEGEIQLVSYNAITVNKLLNNIALVVQNSFGALENGNIDFLGISNDLFDNYDVDLLRRGIICEIPFGAFTNISLISNVGPKLPVRFNLLGDVTANILTDVKEYGINNALLKVSIEVIVNFRVNLPFVSDKISVRNELPISIKVIQGTIPEFYAGGFKSTFGIVNSFYNM